MDPVLLAVIILAVVFGLFALLIYIIFSMTTPKERLRLEIKNMFDAKESDGDLIFTYRGYDVIVTFRPRTKVSIMHNRNVEGVHAPRGASLTPMYLIFKIKKAEELVKKLDEYVDFLDAIPTQ